MSKHTHNIEPKIWRKIGNELHPSHLFKRGYLLPAIVSGALVGVMTTILTISFAVLVFGKAIPEALPIGISMALVSNVILHISSAFASSGEGVVAHVQSLPPPIQAAMLSALMGILPTALPVEGKLMIAVLMILFSAIFTGSILLVSGCLNLGRLVRFLPSPVISGFLASVGFALVIGGISTMTLMPITLVSISSLCSKSLLFKWLMGVFLAVLLWFVAPRWKHALAIPTILAISILFFYTFYYFKGFGIAALMNDNLLLGIFQSGSLWYPPQYFYTQIHLLDWTMLASQIGIIATIPLVSFIGGLLMISAIEFATDSELKPNFELKVMGISNMMSGFLGGGFVGYPSTTFTVMQRSLHSSTRLAGILSAFVPVVVLIFGASLLGFIPRFVVGGLLIYFGYQFIDYWVVKVSKHATFSDMNIIAAIVITSLWLGFVAAVGVGVLAAVGFFLFKYSKTSVIRYISTGALLRSSVTRNAIQDDWLAIHADNVVIFGLQGYIFFGTAYHLHEEIMTQAIDKKLSSVILDFRHVTGMDTSVVQNFQKLYLQLTRKNCTLLFAHLPPQYRGLMHRKGFIKTTEQGFAEFANLDEALEWQENNLLKSNNLFICENRPILSVFAAQFNDADKATILLQYLEPLNIMAGVKVIEQNTLADELFFIESGRLSAYLLQENRPPLRLQTMMADTIIGEIGFYLGQLRTATVIAEEPSLIYRLSKDALTQLEAAHPNVAMALHKFLAEKTAKRVNHISNSLKRFI